MSSQFIAKSKPPICIYGLDAIPLTAKWSGTTPPPAIGETVFTNINQLGSGIVVAYFVEHGWLGIEIKLDKQPAWHKRQNGEGKHALVFGIEIKSVA